MTTKEASKLHRFSDFARDFVGPKVRINEIINREIVVLAFKKRPSKVEEYANNEYGIFQIELDGRKYVLFSSSKVLISQAETYVTQMPFTARITEHNGFYTFA